MNSYQIEMEIARIAYDLERGKISRTFAAADLRRLQLRIGAESKDAFEQDRGIDNSREPPVGTDREPEYLRQRRQFHND
jgi:hypothetical protein